MTIPFRRAVAIFLLLASAYLITYTGRIELGDQLEYFDAVGGVARFGQPLADEAAWQNPPRGSSLLVVRSPGSFGHSSHLGSFAETDRLTQTI